jgi:hypothetical protein
MVNYRNTIKIFFLLFLAACGGPQDSTITPLPISDQNYIHGIAKTGDFLALAPKFKASIEAGDYLIFADRSPRRVTKLEDWGKILGVRVSGEPMNGDTVGNPNTFTVLKNYQTPMNINDINYEKGIAKGFLGFAVPNSEQASKIYSVGNKITLGDGIKRNVIKLNSWESILGVQLDGPSIDIARSGFPNAIIF